VSKAFIPKRKGVITEEDVLTFKRAFIPRLTTPMEVFDDAVKRKAIPLEIRIMAYTKKDRHAYRLDLASDTLLLDVRAGRFPIHAYRKRSPLLYPMFDTVLVSLDVPDIARNMFEMIFESDRVTLNEIAAALGITRGTAENNLATLITRGLICEEKVHHETVYYVNLSAITGVKIEEAPGEKSE
jgi:predicted DNA-binding transcriptional regulator